MKTVETAASYLLALLPLACHSTPPVDPPTGSSEGSRVAVAMPDGPRELTFLIGPRSPEELAALEAVAPNLRLVSGLSGQQALAMAPGVHGIDARYCSEEFLRAAPELRWVQAFSAGVDRYLAIEELMARDEIVFTNMQGVHGPAIADHVFAMLLALTRDLETYRARQAEHRWQRGDTQRAPSALAGQTLFVVGLGGIGREVARRAKGFDMRVLATVRTPRPAPDHVDRLETGEALHELLPQADVVVLCVPLTPETEGLIGAEELAAMKSGAFLINIARGRVVDTEALLAALASGELAGACLDVTDPEPLPADHPLWDAPNLVITPHVASRAALTEERRDALLLENLSRFAAGEPLLNTVDKGAGY